MAITLNWVNKNTGTTNIKIYRGSSPSNLTLLITLPSSATTHTDSTAANNTLYYYRVNVVINALDEIPGGVIPYCKINDTGPGPKTLMTGDMEWGYFGSLTPAEFVTDADLKAAVAVGTANSTALTAWHKFACQGKIIFVPNVYTRYFSSLTPLAALNTLYASGLLYGTGDNGKPHANLTGASTKVLQNKKINAGAYEFYLRAPKGNASTPTDVNAVYANGGVPYYESSYSEISLMACLLSTWLPLPLTIANKTTPPKLYGNSSSASISIQGNTLTQHWYGTGMALTGLAGTPLTCLTVSNTANNSTTYYHAVLELIPS